MALRQVRVTVALAGWLAACGGRVESSAQTPSPLTTEVDAGDGAPNTCPLPTAAVDPLDNCTRYCGGYGCAACPSAIGQCEQLCRDRYAKGHLDAACLACAVENDGAILQRLSCESFVSMGTNTPVFTIEYPEDQCGSVCTLPH
jgi:hypothetical protein